MKPDKRKYPLRKVVSVISRGTLDFETLECGHEYRRREDIAGPTNAQRRRCWRCARQATESPEPKQCECPGCRGKEYT
jgi:hypothetical protein